MADELKQTLYAASGRAEALAIKPTYGGESPAWNVDNTYAGTHDASDATFDHGQVFHDGDDQTGAVGHVRYVLDSCTYSGTISFLRFKWRAKKASLSGVGTVEVRVWYKGASRETDVATTTSFADYYVDSPDDPTNPWTQTTVNALTGTKAPGFFVDMIGEDENDDVEVWVSEFCVEVWGPENQTTNGEPMGAEASMPAGASVIGGLTTAGEAMGAEASMPAGTSVPGGVTTAGEAMGAEASMPAGVSVPGGVTTAGVAMGIEAGIPAHATYPSGVAGERDPEAVTTINAVWRVGYTGDDPDYLKLSDQTMDTLLDVTVNGPAAAGTASVTACIDDDQPYLCPTITHIKFCGLGYARGSAGVTLSDPRIDYGAASPVAISLSLRSGIMPPIGELYPFDFVSDEITEKPGGGAWTWDDINELGLVNIEVDYTELLTLKSVLLLIYELWVEVYGLIGAYVPPITVRQKIGQPARRADIITTALSPTQSAGGFRIHQKINRTL